MKLKHLLAPSALVALCLHAGASFAVGNINGVSATPTTTGAGQNVSVTVQGSGSCPGGIKVTFGDGTQHTSGEGAVLPYAVPAKSYSSGGTKTITASKLDPEDAECFGTHNTNVNIYKIDGVWVNDTTPKNGVAISAYAYGAGVCPTLNIDWGDGNDNNYNNYNLGTHPAKPHTYTSNGIKTITATCGSLSKTKQVNVSDTGGGSGPGGPGGLTIPDKWKWIKVYKWPPKWDPPGPGPNPCLSCPPWLQKIRAKERYQAGLVRQLKRYQGMVKGGKRLTPRQARHMNLLRNRLNRSEKERQGLIRNYRNAFNKRGIKIKPGKRMPAKRHQMR